MLTVFHRDGEVIRHFWRSELFYPPVDPGQDPRRVETLGPLWNLFDLTPEGRPRRRAPRGPGVVNDEDVGMRGCDVQGQGVR